MLRSVLSGVGSIIAFGRSPARLKPSADTPRLLTKNTSSCEPSGPPKIVLGLERNHVERLPVRVCKDVCSEIEERDGVAESVME